ncbi:MAG: thioredoxin family protein [Paracoccaceae bacterium]|nr:thioredoxin family protein [Paracoccaceae bacterium]
MRLIAILTGFLMLLSVPVRAADIPIGDDGLHKPTWLHVTFKDLREDLADANTQGKRLAIIFEQRGCIYCTRMHEKVFPDPTINALLREKFFFVQMNLFGDEEVTDFDGTVLPEKAMARRWGIVFTPTIMFLPEKAPDTGTAAQAAVATMPGAFGIGTTLDMMTWILEKGYEGDEHFQKYHARKIAERRAAKQ